MSLYTRMLFSVCVNLYISRVVLDILGVEDFGIFNIVAGIVVLLGFINSSMSGSTSRFLTIAIGEKNDILLRDTYNAAKHLHLIIALIVVVIGETFGLWLVNSYLNIPINRVAAANWVYQLSLFTTAITIIQVPYSSIIISMERMDIYAGIEIINIMLKLAAVLLLKHYMHDKLIMYVLLLFIVAVLVYLIYRLFCRKNYGYLVYSTVLKWSIMKPMLVFSGWDLLGWGGLYGCTQGRQIFINKFFGIAVNAANGMAATAGSAITTFTNNIVMAFRPRIIKHYAAQDYSGMQELEELALIVVLLLMNILIVPLCCCMGDILSIWLVEVPDKTNEFCQLLLFLSYFEAINTVIKIGIHASGKMRNFTIASFLFNLLNLVLTYVFYRTGESVYITYYVAIIICLFTIAVNIFFLKRFISPLKVFRFIIWICKGVFVGVGGFAIVISIGRFYEIQSPLSKFIIITGINSFVVLIAACFFLPTYAKRLLGQFQSKIFKR